MQSSRLLPERRVLSTERRILIGCIILYSVGNVAGWLTPEIVFGAVRNYGVTAGQASFLTLIEGLTAGIVSISLGVYPPRMTFRKLAWLGMTMFIATNTASHWAPAFDALLAIRFVSGLADGALIFVSVSLIAIKSTTADRSYAAMNVMANLFGAATLASLPALFPNVHGLAYLPFVAALSLLFMPMIGWIPGLDRPRRPAHGVGTAGLALPPRKLLPLLFLIAMIIPEGFQSFSMFAFAPAVGAGIGMNEAAITAALGTAILASIAGPFIAGLIADRFGRWLPCFVASVLFVAANAAFVRTTDPMIFRLALVTNLTCAFFLMPLFLAWAAELDPSGRFGSIVMGTLVVLPACSPAVAGLFYDRIGATALPILVDVTSALFIGLLIMLGMVLVMQRKHSSVTSIV